MGSSRSSCKHCGERLSVSAVKDYPNVCLYLISFCKCNYFQSECKEGTIKESVHKKHLAYKKDKVLTILFKSDFTFRVINKTWVKYCPLRGFPQIALPQIVIKSGVFTKLTQAICKCKCWSGSVDPFSSQIFKQFFRVGTRIEVNSQIISHL